MFDPQEWKMFIAIPLNNKATRSDCFARPELFHFIDIDWDTAETIGRSVFSNDAMNTTDEYPIEPGEDPFFTPEQVSGLLESLEKWRHSLTSDERGAFSIVEKTLLEAKERGVGIYFKF